jgi:hypothetical protein
LRWPWATPGGLAGRRARTGRERTPPCSAGWTRWKPPGRTAVRALAPGYQPTEAGALVLDQARRMADQAEEIERRVLAATANSPACCA